MALAVRRAQPRSKRGMGPVGLARARDFSAGRPVSLRTVQRTLAFLRRHAVSKGTRSWRAYGKSWQAYHGWGGDAAMRWAAGILREEGLL